MAKQLEELLKESGEEVLFEGAPFKVEEITRLREKEKNMDKDYTQKTQQVASLRKELEKQIAEVQPWLELAEHMKQHPEQAEKIQAIMEGSNLPEGTKPQDVVDKSNAHIKKLEEKLADLEGKMTTKEQLEDLNRKTLESQNFIADSLKETSKTYPRLRPKVVLSELLSLPGLNDMTQEDLSVAITKLSELSHKEEIDNEKRVTQEYIDGKRKDFHRTEGGGNPPGSPPATLTAKDLSSGNIRRNVTKILQQMNSET